LADTVLAPLVVPDFRATDLVVPDFRPTDLGLGRFAAAVPTLTSVGLAAAVLARLVVPDFTAADFVLRRFAAGAAFLAVVFVARRDRTGRSLMVCTSLLVG
jgi:hypothetical protein